MASPAAREPFSRMLQAILDRGLQIWDSAPETFSGQILGPAARRLYPVVFEHSRTMQVEAQRIFKQLDQDDSGALEVSELRLVLERLYNKLVAAGKLREILDVIDVDDDGKIDFDEFQRILLRARPDHIPEEHSVLPFLCGEVVASLYESAGLLPKRPGSSGLSNKEGGGGGGGGSGDAVYTATSFASDPAVGATTRGQYSHPIHERVVLAPGVGLSREVLVDVVLPDPDADLALLAGGAALGRASSDGDDADLDDDLSGVDLDADLKDFNRLSEDMKYSTRSLT